MDVGGIGVFGAGWGIGAGAGVELVVAGGGGGVGWAGAAGLAAFDFVEGSIEEALQAGFEQGETHHGPEGAAGLGDDVAGAGGGVGAVVVLVVIVLFEGGHAAGDVVGLVAAGAAKAPPGVGGLVDEGGFDVVGGLEVPCEGLEEVVEVGGVFGGEEGLGGGEAVF